MGNINRSLTKQPLNPDTPRWRGPALQLDRYDLAEEWARFPSFARDAHCCIMVEHWVRPHTGSQRDVRARWLASSTRILSSSRSARLTRPTYLACRRARNRQGQVASRWCAATPDVHCARRQSKIKVGTGDGRQLDRTRRWEVDFSLTAIAHTSCSQQRRGRHWQRRPR